MRFVFSGTKSPAALRGGPSGALELDWARPISGVGGKLWAGKPGGGVGGSPLLIASRPAFSRKFDFGLKLPWATASISGQSANVLLG